MKNTFKRSERLKKMTIIQDLFRKGSSFAVYPIRIVWMELPLDSPYPAQIAVTVPKKNFKKAVDRNRIRRKLKESFRLNKAGFYGQLKDSEKQYAMMLIYTAKEAMPFEEIDKKLKKLLHKFLERIKVLTPIQNKKGEPFGSPFLFNLLSRF